MNRLFITASALLLTVLAYAQGFSQKTNAIRLNYNQPVTPTVLPQIQWVSPGLEYTATTEKSLTLEASVTSSVPLKSIMLEYTNGGKTTPRVMKFTEGATLHPIKQDVRLLDGENEFRLIVENTNGAIVSARRSVVAGQDAVSYAVDANRKDYALLFAIDSYDSWDDLTNPVNDARAIGALLKDMYGFEVELVENATNDEILAKIYDYNTRRFNPQDQLFVFFAGHGSFDETVDEGFVVASNSLLNDKARTSYISHVLLRERLNNIKCEHIFLVMDVCFGGSFDPVLAKARAGEDMDEETDKQYLVKKLTKRTRKYLTSGGKEYVSDGTPGKHSPFAEKFVLALKETGGSKGRIMTLIELRAYFLKLATEPRFNGFGSDDPASDFVFVRRN